MNNQRGMLTIISGFSGAGKGTIVKEIFKTYKDDYSLSISATTRKPREGEVDGVQYFFLDKEVFEQKIKEVLSKHQIDLIVLAGFMSILSENFTKDYPQRIVNVHPSLIPSFCGKGYYGLRVHEEALSYGVKVTGATVHFVNEIPDGGQIILQKAVSVEDGDTPEVLQKRVMEQAEWIILPAAVEMVSKKLLA